MKQAFAEPLAAQSTSSQVEGKTDQMKGSVAASRWKSVMAASAAQENMEGKKFNPYLDVASDNNQTTENESEMVDQHVDGEAMDEDEDVDGMPMDDDDENIDGVPMTDSDEDMEDDDGGGIEEEDDGNPLQETKETRNDHKEDAEKELDNKVDSETGTAITQSGSGGFKFQMGGSSTTGKDGSKSQVPGEVEDNRVKRKRMRAEDMFAADDEEDDEGA